MNHLSLHPFSPGAVEAVKAELGTYELSKGTIRFSADNPIPESILKRIIDYRLQEIVAPKQH